MKGGLKVREKSVGLIPLVGTSVACHCGSLKKEGLHKISLLGT